MRQRLQIAVSVFVGVLLGVSLSNGVKTGFAASKNYEYLELFTKVLHHVQDNYVEPVDTKKLIEGAIAGMLATLDPHTLYLSADQFREIQVDTTGKFGGLGIEVTVIDGYLTVVTPIEDTPAFHAGVEPGDRIVAIEDKVKKIKKSTKGISLQDAVDLMRGKVGSKVTVYVWRKDVKKPIEIEIKREIIKVASVKGGLVEKDFAWLRVTTFQTNTTSDLRAKIATLQKQNKAPLRGVVLDLRNNPGGLLEEAVGVAGLFLGRVPVVSTIGRDKSKKDVEYSRGTNPYKDFRVVVLVNEYSASASEIVAGALQDHKRGLVIGKQTFGKGSVQSIIDLQNKAGLKLTVARYYTPSGRSIQSKGITPDVEVERLDASLVEKARASSKALREADLSNHILGEGELQGEPDLDLADTSQAKSKDEKKLTLDDPKELIKTDYQLQQALGFLKAWDVFEAFNGPGPVPRVRSTASKGS